MSEGLLSFQVKGPQLQRGDTPPHCAAGNGQAEAPGLSAAPSWHEAPGRSPRNAPVWPDLCWCLLLSESHPLGWHGLRRASHRPLLG